MPIGCSDLLKYTSTILTKDNSCELDIEVRDAAMVDRPDEKDRGIDKLKRGFFIAAGTISLGVGAIGIFVPLLPTTPLLLLSAACYLRGSKRMHHWMLNNKWFGAYISNYKAGRGIPLRTKVLIVALLWIVIGYSAYLVNLFLVQIALVAVAIVVSIHIVTLPTFKKP